MTAAWAFYAIIVGCLLAFAAFVTEHSLQAARRASRVAWLSALVLIPAWPVATRLLLDVPNRVKTAPPRAGSDVAGGAPVRQSSRDVEPTSRPAIPLPDVIPHSGALERTITVVFVAAPLGMILVLLLDFVRIARARRRWRTVTVDGVTLLVSPHFGPAIVGVWHPQIVIPEWGLALPSEQRRLLLAHENEHVARRDAICLLLGAVAVACAPWNPSAWWTFRRLRLAIEVDCDRRVLQRGHDLVLYGNLLLGIGRHTRGGPFLAMAFAERRSMLRTRINLITARPAGLIAKALGPLGATAALLAACAVRPSPRTPDAVSPAPAAVGAFADWQLVGESAPLTGDSVVLNDGTLVPRRTAIGLPREFAIAPSPSGGTAGSSTCPPFLRDSSSGATLQIAVEVRPQTAVIHAGDGTVVGFYAVSPVGRYGVPKDAWLRVRCSRPRQLQLLGSYVKAPPFGLGRRHLYVTADSIHFNANGTRLDLVFHGNSADWPQQRVRAVADTIGMEATRSAPQLDTLTITVAQVHVPSSSRQRSATTWFFYPNRHMMGGR
ncbi:MAG: M56 family metallopeptidase [Gemmatimonadales bacterium]